MYSVYKHHGRLNNVLVDFKEIQLKEDKSQIKHILNVLGVEIAEGDSIFEAFFLTGFSGKISAGHLKN